MNIIHKPLVDSFIEANLFQELALISRPDVDYHSWTNDAYSNCFLNWIRSSSNYKINGLEHFPHVAYCSGTTDGIQSFIHRHGHKRRLRFSRGEFAVSKIVCNHAGFSFAYLEDCDLDQNDALVISLPFSSNGGVYPTYELLIEQCNKLGIPVLLDLAYIGISQGLDINLTAPCITDVVFSLSKPISAQLRLGLRITRSYHDDAVQFNYEAKMYNRIAAKVGINIMNKYSQDYIISKYLPRQQEICQKLNLTPTNTVTLALGNETDHKEFHRNGFYRICITDELLQYK
jgi:hypothetical protein